MTLPGILVSPRRWAASRFSANSAFGRKSPKPGRQCTHAAKYRQRSEKNPHQSNAVPKIDDNAMCPLLFVKRRTGRWRCGPRPTFQGIYRPSTDMPVFFFLRPSSTTQRPSSQIIRGPFFFYFPPPLASPFNPFTQTGGNHLTDNHADSRPPNRGRRVRLRQRERNSRVTTPPYFSSDRLLPPRGSKEAKSPPVGRSTSSPRIHAQAPVCSVVFLQIDGQQLVPIYALRHAAVNNVSPGLLAPALHLSAIPFGPPKPSVNAPVNGFFLPFYSRPHAPVCFSLRVAGHFSLKRSNHRDDPSPAKTIVIVPRIPRSNRTKQ